VWPEFCRPGACVQLCALQAGQHFVVITGKSPASTVCPGRCSLLDTFQRWHCV
jgi:hypothetical protein